MGDAPSGSAADLERHRGRLFGLAYRMLGSVADAEDIVQDAFVRWQRSDHASVANPEAYLSRIVTRLCIDHMRAARTRREIYVGPWLPEPLVDDNTTAPTDAVEIAHDVSVALMLALERLSPLERAAFLLHDVFDQSFDSIGQTLDRSAAACRKLAARARGHVQSTAPRRYVPEPESAKIINAFGHAVRDGNLDALKKLLAEDAVLYSDGGGKINAANRPLNGRDLIARFYASFQRQIARRQPVSKRATVNGMPGLVTAEIDGTIQTTAFEIAEGEIRAIYVVRNPDKLMHVSPPPM